MHRTLEIPELVELIFAELHDTSNSSLLAALARTCRTFQNPALDILWRRQFTLLNFLKCFPEDLIETVVELGRWDKKLTNFRILRPMSNDDWTRPLFYAPRVQELYLRNELRIGSWAELPTQYFGAYMFPNLKSLGLDHYTPHSLVNLEWLLSPRIWKIDLDFGPNLAALSRIIPTLTGRCPSLTDITISTDEPEKSLHTVSAFVRSLVRVERLSVRNLDGAAFEHLGRLPTLKTLAISDPEVPSDICPSTLSATSLSPMYSSLEFLYFSSTTLEKVTAFINIIARCQLQILHAGLLNSLPTRDVATLFFAALAAHCSPHSLRQIHTGKCNPWISGERDTIDGVTLQILSCFTNLVNANLPPPLVFDLDDADVGEMARAWPRIESLELRCASDMPPRITLRGLAFLAQHCPHLSSLKMDFDATAVPEWDGTAATNPLQTSPTRVLVENCPIVTPGPVAAFMSRIFPNATIRMGSWDEDGELRSEAEILNLRRWEEVRHILKETRAREEDAVMEDAESLS
ncbi:hypothetical protein DFH09DRAFT_976857 [Mycena vulgaris]|nr:hypothetical protein DFH09DRAFT_976857 [Mycena vulgaris]